MEEGKDTEGWGRIREKEKGQRGGRRKEIQMGR